MDLGLHPHRGGLRVGGAEAVGEDDELVTAVPGDRVAVAYGLTEPPGDLDEDAVPPSCPKRVLIALKSRRAKKITARPWVLSPTGAHTWGWGVAAWSAWPR